MREKIISAEREFWLTPREIYDYLDQYVIGQERAKKVVAISAYNHFKRVLANQNKPRKGYRLPLLKKSNLLLIGPTGCGKTHIARTLSEILQVPFVVVDATEYTEAGYYGKDVEVMIGELLYSTNLEVEKVERGIVFIDEIDKISRRTDAMRDGAYGRDIRGEGVQQALLKLLEGAKIFVPYNLTQHWNKHDFVQVDTTNILFICAGTFTDLYKSGRARPMGFKKGEKGKKEIKPVEERITTEDLLRYGMLAEFLGRIPVIVELDELTEDEMMRIVAEPPDCLLKEYRGLMALDEIELDFPESAIREVVQEAKRRKLGARGLRTIFEEVMRDYMFLAPEMTGKRIVITASDVREKLGRDSAV